MKSLLERAKPQLLHALANRQETLGPTINDYKKQLSEGHYVYKVEYATALDLLRWVEQDTGEKESLLWNLFEKD
jgi:hypothetical protein